MDDSNDVARASKLVFRGEQDLDYGIERPVKGDQICVDPSLIFAASRFDGRCGAAKLRIHSAVSVDS